MAESIDYRAIPYVLSRSFGDSKQREQDFWGSGKTFTRSGVFYAETSMQALIYSDQR
jgi:hypothetical protein